MYHNTNERAVRQTNPMAGAGVGPGGMPPTYGASRASGPAPSTAGHHTHDILNKLDPRVDSTHDHQPMPSATQPVHSSKLANALDPRVDTRSANAAVSSGLHQPAMHGAAAAPAAGGMHNNFGNTHHRSAGAPEGTYGPHSSRAANAMDPRVDSDMDSVNRHGMRNQSAAIGAGYGSGVHGSGAHGAGMGAGTMRTSHLPGPAPNTAGPHKSDLMNKLDPRVDSKGTSGMGMGTGAGAGTGTYRGGDVRRGI